MGERARIRRIQVSKLFGIFDHEIQLNLEDRITILHGPNGYGKTVILQMLARLFSGQWEKFETVPFEEFFVELEDAGVLRVRREHRWEGAPLAPVCSYIETPGSEPQIFDIADARVLTLSRGSKVIRPPEPPRYVEPEWLTALRSRLGVYLIHTQRLGFIKTPRGTVGTVTFYSGKLAAQINSLLATYAARSQELDSTFLDRLLQEDKGPLLPMAVIEERLRQIEDKRSQLIALGFLDQERDAHKSLPKIDPSKLDVLSVYVDDTEKKLAVFDELAQKVQFLTDAVNKRFRYKRMSVSREGGFIFTSSADATTIPLASLSSGEQHELVLFYELLFKVEPDTLVLIDEPEISLHLAWQQQFLGDLVEMVKLARFDVLLATHAPSVIGKRWDLTVELKGPELEDAAQ